MLCLQGCDRTSSNPWKLAACWCILAGEFRLTGFILMFVLQLHLTRSLRHGIYRLRHAMTTKIQVFLCLKRDQSAADQMLLETVSTNMALSAVSGWTTGLLTTVVLALQHHSGPKQASTSPRNRRLNCTKKNWSAHRFLWKCWKGWSNYIQLLWCYMTMGQNTRYPNEIYRWLLVTIQKIYHSFAPMM